MNRKIRILSPQSISKIAAGEVIENSLSVIKELVENSIDSKATEIVVTVKDAGKSFISVSDNGCGIEKDELHMAFIRHATSKLQDDSIYDIQYLGFRGEALASILAVSDITIITKTEEEDHAWELSLSSLSDEKNALLNDNTITTEIQEKISNLITPKNRAKGTTIEVKGLFAPTPNKLRFLKNNNAELHSILQFMHSIALAYQNCNFKLFSESKLLFDTTRDQFDDDILKQRIIDIFGNEFTNNIAKVSYTGFSREIKINGYVTIPTYTPSIRKQKSIIFVNGRLIHDYSIICFIKAAYSGLIANNLKPLAILFIEIPLQDVDVNIHPHKTEVKFSDITSIKNAVVNAVREALSSPYIAQSLTENQLYSGFDTSYNLSNEYEARDSYKHSNQDKHESTLLPLSARYPIEDFTAMNKAIEERITESQLDDKLYYFGNPICQISNLFIISYNSNTDDLFVIEQHAAHERVMLEKMKDALLHKKKLKMQNLLLPISTEISGTEAMIILEQHDTLLKYGIKIKMMQDKIHIVGIPIILQILPSVSPHEKVIQILNHVIQNSALVKEISETAIIEIYNEVACHSSILKGKSLSKEEMCILLREMERYNFTAQCNHGRPTYIKITHDFLLKIFQR
ncbi:DNA mismatch repair protein MutL [Candidatus Fokinia solitaria]|uniref:DNA mismatch repair protein MutL n=1 Tax=Candidatus Fokinia solitaria TaxID=1802984 RepID=A0A2U8BSA7_9RICK|nr:DNA mismatch repair endonuclease MutL [Candidatus Fokinia solitaria]AWD33246.1 DNA mismatch repair protein MutL [Candidatus Fokinia solitaria]